MIVFSRITTVIFALILFATISVIYYDKVFPSRQEFKFYDNSSWGLQNSHQSGAVCQPPSLAPQTGSDSDAWDSSRYIVGSPTDKHKDNLRNDTYYITSWSNAGFTNQFISYLNMVYLGAISDRIPVIPPFAPDHHISSEAGNIRFGEVFNLTHLRQSMRTPILEWSDIKALAPDRSTLAPSMVEAIGCWSTRPEVDSEPIKASNLMRHLGLDVSYTRLPPSVHRLPEQKREPHVGFFPIMEMIFPSRPSHNPEDFPLMASSPLGSTLGPETHMACFDYMYFATSGTMDFDWTRSWSPAWRLVGRHLRFAEPMVHLSKSYLRKALEVTTDELPLFIAVHIRRGDFADQCWDDSIEGCLPPLSSYAERVKDVQEQLLERRDLNISTILVTSDEHDPAFWDQVSDQGWKYINHTAEQTFEQYGEWYPPIIDIVAQSLAVGFVGTADSTVSLVSERRVEDWNYGVTTTVWWGGRSPRRVHEVR